LQALWEVGQEAEEMEVEEMEVEMEVEMEEEMEEEMVVVVKVGGAPQQ
jgi:hypothetical protein